MAKKSEKAPAHISATEASRSFSRLLDEVEAGRSYFVHRRGRAVCAMTPPRVQGRLASDCLEILRGRSPVLLDEGFGAELLEIVSEEIFEESPSWDS